MSIRLIYHVYNAMGILREIRPQLVIGFGAYGSLPFLLAAKVCRIPTLIHEQNIKPGKANLFLAFLVDRIALSHRESVRYLPRFLHHKTAVTGNPVRLEIANTTRAQARASLGLKDVFTILVLGGSQGSSYLNTLVPQALIGLAGEFGFQVIHVCGGKDTEYLNAVYSRLSCNYKIFTYLEEMHLAYGASDLVISRSGATTIAEICLRGLPAILIPYPGAGRHQDLNAQFLGNRGAAVLLADTVGLQELIQILRRLLISPQECRVMAEAAHRLADGRATDKLLTQALALVKERAS